MAGLSSPLRLAPPITPRRAPSPTMSPGRRRALGSSEELRDLSPDTTLRAFTQRPMPFDTTCDEYKIFSCIETLTAAERDLGARVARAAQRLKSWCSEIEQWGWTGSFAPPSEEYREQRRRSLELRIREHVGDADLSNSLPPLEYWGSLLSVEVESHEARLDDIEEELIKLDVDELKEHVLDMHPSGRSRPSSAGLEAHRQNYKPMDDFSFLITQTLLSALPHHVQLKERLGTWTARVSLLRQVPQYLDDLNTAQKAMRLGWDAIEPPTDTSDMAFKQWKEAVDTISGVLRDKIGDLGKRLDGMLDALEGRDDCIPDNWIDIFEGVESDYGRWAHESRRKIIEFDVRRRSELNGSGARTEAHSNGASLLHSTVPAQEMAMKTVAPATSAEFTTKFPTPSHDESISPVSDIFPVSKTQTTMVSNSNGPGDITAPSKFKKNDISSKTQMSESIQSPITGSPVRESNDDSSSNTTAQATPTSSRFAPVSSPTSSAKRAKPWFFTDSTEDNTAKPVDPVKPEPLSPSASTIQITRENQTSEEQLVIDPTAQDFQEPTPDIVDDESEFDEGDTVIHNDLDEEEEDIEETPIPITISAEADDVSKATPAQVKPPRKRPENLSKNPIIVTSDGQHSAGPEPPQTPRLRSGSTGSMSSEMSFDSSPPSTIEESPSVRNAAHRAIRAPRPELNAAMSKRRTGKLVKEAAPLNPPWPPSQFTQNANNSTDDLERKISDILTTIPAHIRLTSGPGADAPEVKSSRTVSAKGSRGYLRAARSVSGLKSPELTLSPAKNDFDSGNIASGRRSAAAARNDNDIKLYHLTQPGKEQPVKLFIRRVGENGERVMVRVGGGWADLGEYLRQYAEHHGRRTASEGKFEILGLEVKNSDGMTSPNRPESVMSKGDRRVSSAYHPTSPTTTPIKSNAGGVSRDEAPPRFGSSPGGADEPTVPSTNSSQRSWQGNEVGLAGPNTKKLDLSGDKLEWIEGMMKQARTVSGTVLPANHTPAQREERAESRSDSRSDSRTGTRKTEFGDLGKVGGTKRIFLRGGRPSLE